MHGFCDPKVDDFDVSFLAEEDIGGFEIAVDDLQGRALVFGLCMCVVECFAHFDGDLCGEGPRQWLFGGGGLWLEELTKVDAFDAFHCDVEEVLIISDVVDFDDVGVMELRGETCFSEHELLVIGAYGCDIHAFEDHMLAKASKS
jgi:hypothetical protein